MNFKRVNFLLLLFFLCLNTVFAGDPAFLQVQQSTNFAPDPATENSVKIINRSDNPDFINSRKTKKSEKINTIKTLVPYEDLYKVLQQDIGKYFILPIDEFEALKKAKEAWLASQSTPVAEPPPVLYQIHSARIEGSLEENFAHLEAVFKIETYKNDWHEIPILWGSMAVESVTLDGLPITLKTNWVSNSTRQVNFGKLSKQNFLQNYYQGSISPNDTLSQENWKDTIFSIPIKGEGTHVCKISFMVPVQSNDDLYNLQFHMAQIPLVFMRLDAADFTLSVDSTSFVDYSVDEGKSQDPACTFIGWLGANSDVSIRWRRKYTRSKPVIEKPSAAGNQAQVDPIATQTEEIKAEEPKPIIQPLVYARSNTLISLGETSITGFKTINYSISKAPVSSFSFSLPEYVEIVSVNADRPHTFRQIKEGSHRKLRVEFMAGREDTCRIEILYEAPVDLNQNLTLIPTVAPLGVEREIGSIAVEALTSIEVQNGNDDANPLNSGVYPLDPLEAPQPLKDRATRPILLAFRHNIRNPNILLRIKRYQDVNQQTVVADRMDVKTTFTTNKTSNTLLNMKIRNNNKQYLQLQLGSGTEVISAFRSGKPVKLVASKNDGKVQIPLEMSQTIGQPVEMTLQVLLKQPVDEIKWRGSLDFMPPLVDIPVSRFNWQIFAPEHYKLYNFQGTVKETLPRRDPFFFRGFMRILRAVWAIISSPETLFAFIFIVFVILLAVARKFLWRLLVGIWNLVSSIFASIFSGKGFRLAELMIVFAIVGMLFTMAIPNFRKAREQARDKACYANIRVIQGAVEMYNLDHQQMMKNLDLNALLRGGYIKSMPTKPEPGCRYENRGSLDSNGKIVCRLHGAVDEDIPPSASVADQVDIYANENRSERKKAKHEVMMDEDNRQFAGKDKALSALWPGAANKPGFGFGSSKTKGMLPIQVKFVMTSNHYNLERDLVIADIASNGALLANRTCPKVRVNYLWLTALRIGEIFALILSLFAGLYFVSGAFYNYSSKITFAALVVLILSGIDLQLPSIGEMANIGLWLAILGGVIWKIIWIVSKIKIEKDGSDELPPMPPIKPQPTADKTETAAPEQASSGQSNVVLLILVCLLMGILLPLAAAGNEREIRVMAPFKELEKVIPAGDRVVIIPEKDYEYLKDIVEPEKPTIKAPQSFRFENVIYKGKIEEKGVRFIARYTLNLLNEGWKSIALLTTSAIPSDATIDDKPLSLTTINHESFPAYGFMTDATGTCNVEVKFFVPLSSSEYKHTSKFSLPMVPVCLSSLELTVNETDCEAWIDPGVLRPAEKLADKTIFRALLPPTNVVRFELYRNVVAAPAKPMEPVKIKDEKTETQPVVIEEKSRITARELNLLYFKEGFVSGISNFDIKIKGGSGIASLTFKIPEKIRILKIENKLIEDWKLLDNGDERTVEVYFKSKIRGNTNLTIEFEQDIQELKNENYQVPEIILTNAEQSYGILGIGCLQTLEINVNSMPQGYSPILAAEFLKEWKKGPPEKTPYAFKFLKHPNNLVLSISRPEDISQQTAVIDKAEALTLLNEDGYLLTRIVYEVRNNSQQFLKVKLPVIASKTAELWSTQVAGESVRAGFDQAFGVYNLPIVRSPIVGGESKSFPVEIVYVVKTDNPLRAFNRIYLELPQAHLPVSELSWILYLPEGYELMRETGNLDRQQTTVKTKFLNNSSYFQSLDSFTQARSLKAQITNSPYQQQKIIQMKRKIAPVMQSDDQQDRVFGTTGLLPVKFSIPTTSWSTSFTMLQIEPEGRAPYIEGMLVNPRKGKGFFFQAVMILIGILGTLGLVKMFTGKSKYLWFLFLFLQVAIVALAVYLKLYQADHFAQMGFATSFCIYLLYKFFAWRPKEAGK
ncbi:MAG: hypothetical protein Kow0029_17430 [Candidatus Rifleibacteriota bacterium]